MGTSSASSSWILATVSRSFRESCGWPRGSTRPRSKRASSPSRPSRRATGTRAIRRCSPPRSPPPTTSSRRWSPGSPGPFTGSRSRSNRSLPRSAPPRPQAEIRMSERDTEHLRVLVLQHEDPTPPGLIGDWLREYGARVETFRIDLDDREVDPADYDLIVSLGSEFAAFDDSKPFVRRETELMRRALDADVPVLGLCFGGQMLARVLGGRVFRSDRSEIGWLPVRSKDPDLVPEGPWFQWHFDSFTLPPGAEAIAESDVGPQAFVAGRSLGL